MFAMVFKCFSVVFANISEACLKCFICLLLYVASVASGRFRNRSEECRVSADQISSGISRLHDGQWWRADHALAAVVNSGLRQLSDNASRRHGPRVGAGSGLQARGVRAPGPSGR
jgi:hypothetical protein